MKRIVSASLIAAAFLAGPGRPVAWGSAPASPPPVAQPCPSAAAAPAAAAPAAQQPATQESTAPGSAAPAGGTPGPAPQAAGAPDAPAQAAPAPSQPAPAGAKAAGLKQWVESHKRTKKAIFFGALAGAAAGALTEGVHGRNMVKGAVVGAVAGGIAGFLIGRNQDKIFAGRDRAVELAHYDPSQGYVMRVEEMSFEPANAKPGQTATLSVRYLVIGPDPSEAITVNCFRGIKHGKDDGYLTGDQAKPFVVPHGGGIVTTHASVTIPDQAPAGTYAVEAMFEDPRGRFQQTRSSPLYIVS